MIPERAARQRADEVTGDAAVVTGPLKGYHHETYVLSLPGGRTQIKLREPRAEILWFDRRSFLSEEHLLRALEGRITRIPEVLDVEGTGFQRFVKGRVLTTRRGAGRRVPDAAFDQIIVLFHELVWITPDTIGAVERRCENGDRAEDGDTDGFLERLIFFMEEYVYERNRMEFGDLFAELGVGPESFVRLRKSVIGLKKRPFCLLHGDLHRKNFIVDTEGKLWTIDWELAMLGDPLYDLATHLHLMRYPADQERRMAREWCRAVERVRPGSSHAWQDDLPRLLDFKRVQSVFTDVIRVSLSLTYATEFNWVALPQAVRKLQRVLVAAAKPLGLEQLPSHSEIMAALVRRHAESRGPEFVRRLTA